MMGSNICCIASPGYYSSHSDLGKVMTDVAQNYVSNQNGDSSFIPHIDNGLFYIVISLAIGVLLGLVHTYFSPDPSRTSKRHFKRRSGDKLKKKEPHAIPGEAECVICLHRAGYVAFLPCGHQCACLTCSARVMKSTKRCPICTCPSRQARRIFPSGDVKK